MFFKRNRPEPEPELDGDAPVREAWGFTRDAWQELSDAERREYREKILIAGLAQR